MLEKYPSPNFMSFGVSNQNISNERFMYKFKCKVNFLMQPDKG